MSEKKKRTLHNYRRHILLGIVGCITVLILLTLSWPTIRQSYWQWQLNQAMNRWEQNEPDHYRYHEMMCALRCFHTIITVKNSEIVKAVEVRNMYSTEGKIETPYEDLSSVVSLSIERKFDSIEQSLNEVLFADTPISVTYDNQYGYPVVVTNHFCVFVGINPITGFCEPYNTKRYIGDFEVISDE